MSRDWPRQDNGYNCGIFTLTSMSLVRNGLCLSKEAYTQGTLTLRRARRRLAEHIWAMEDNSEAAKWSPQGATTTTPEEAPSTRRMPGRDGYSRKRKKGAKGRLALGSFKLRRRWWGSRTGQPCRKEGRGSKRSAKSDTEEEGSDRTRVRVFQSPEKKARNLIAGH